MTPENDEYIIVKKSFPKNTVLCHEGDQCKNIYYLLNGAIRVTKDEQIVNVVNQKGSFFGEVTPLFTKPYSTTLTVVEESECLIIPATLIDELSEKNITEKSNFLNILAENLLKKSKPFIKAKKETIDEISPQTKTNKPISLVKENIYLISERNTFKSSLSFHFNPLGYNIIHYHDPTLVIKEIEKNIPEMIIFNTIDFPRHWKPLLKLIREEKSYEESIFILITNNNFTIEEAAKATYLRVNGILPENLLDKTVILQLFELLKRYKNIDENRKFIRLIPKESDKFSLLFTHPKQKTFVSGKVIDISLEGANFKPSHPSLTIDLKTDDIITNCSLRIGKDIITVNCRIVHNTNEIGLVFDNFEKNGHQKLFKYLMESSERELKSKVS